MRTTVLWRPGFPTRVTLAVVSLVALLGPTVSLFFDPEAAGLAPNHGHIGTPQAIAHHVHRYDKSTHSAGETPTDVVFTPSDEASVASAALPMEPPTLDVPPVVNREGSRPSGVPPESRRELVPTPPPRV